MRGASGELCQVEVPWARLCPAPRLKPWGRRQAFARRESLKLFEQEKQNRQARALET